MIAKLGLIALGFIVLRFVWEAFIRPPKKPARWGAQMGSWALITGAASGVGRGFAHVLAQKGFSVLLVDRDPRGLADTAAEIKQCSPSSSIQTEICDFSRPHAEWTETIRAAIGDKDIGLLVNNVGVNTKLPDLFVAHNVAEIDPMFAVNVEATVAMTHLVLPDMIKRKRGGIIMLSSYTGTYPCPMMAVYSATKAFIDTFATALYQEVREHGIDVLAIRPFYVVSNMSGFRKPSFMVRSAQGLAHDTLRYLGYGPRAQPYWVHRLFEAVFALIPIKMALRLTHSRMISTRARIIASAERYQKKLREQQNSTSPRPIQETA